ncbi:MAG: DUF2283 domain-containing protein [Dolichospermum sp. JUN01]|jgi:uncharacterized protein YuzE|nr:DUF2283 domain-containing protein [Dolichospermum sp. DEX182a]MBO1057745.1 DUF2283 domain-containing protein [Dolichospermum sp. JUN01]QSV52808.1 MAG: DUF2283 domain-containing protein [Dolichospermum sp. UKL201]
MKVHIDEEADALYLRLDESKIIESEEIYPGIVLDFNEQDQVVGIEVLQLSSRINLTTKNIKVEISQS